MSTEFRGIWRDLVNGHFDRWISNLRAGSGDQHIYLIRNFCNSPAIKEIEAIENIIKEKKEYNPEEELKDLVSLYLRHGFITYGSNRLKELSASEKVHENFLKESILAYPTLYEAHYYYGDILKSKGNSECLISAIRHYQEASKEPHLYIDALKSAGECFSKLGWETAASSCLHRANDFCQDNDRRSIIYNFATSHEYFREYKKSEKYHQLLLSWDIEYRDSKESLKRLKDINIKSQGGTKGNIPRRRENDIDRMISMLETYTPRLKEVDEILMPILKSRMKELSEEPGDLESVVCEYTDDSNSRPKSELYKTETYKRFDCLPPEDEWKKQLEMINFLSIIKSQEVERNFQELKRNSLDIGSATGRYPSKLSEIGYNAIGIDNQDAAINYANSKKGQAENPKYINCDALDLSKLYEKRFDLGLDSEPSDGQCFDLITCMMGTFAYIKPEEHDKACKEWIKALRPGGSLVISTLDIECEYLTFLSMYSQSKKDELRNNSLTIAKIEDLLEKNKLDLVKIIPFSFLPDTFIQELNFDELHQDDYYDMAEYDLAVRSKYPNSHGQMYMIYARKKNKK